MDMVAPHDLNVERALLGAILTRESALDTVIDTLEPDDFFREAHRLIYRAMVELRHNSETIDYVTVKTFLERHGQLSEIRLSYLTALTDGVPRSANADAYAQLVLDYADRRALQATCHEAIHGMADNASAEEAATMLLTRVRDSVRVRGENAESLGDALSSLLNDLDKPIETTTTGISALDQLGATFRPGELMLLAGRPGHGKTALALHMAQAAASAGSNVWFASLEMTSRSLSMRWLARDAQVSMGRLRNGSTYTPEEYTRMSSAVERLSALPISIDDHAPFGLGKLRRAIMGTGGILIVDYLQLLQPSRETQGYRSREAEVSYLSRGLKAIAHDCRATVLALSQLNRAVESRPDRKPMLSDLRSSGSLEQDADIVLLVSREEEATTLHLAKHRNGPMGRINLMFDGATQQFRERGPHDPMLEERDSMQDVVDRL